MFVSVLCLLLDHEQVQNDFLVISAADENAVQDFIYQLLLLLLYYVYFINHWLEPHWRNSKILK